MRTEYIINTAMEQVLGILTPSNRLVMKTILHTGLRVSDVLALRSDQLKTRFYITERKTGKRRLVTLNRELLEELRRNCGKLYVFPHRTDPNRHRTRQAVWADVKRAARAYRLPQNVGTHTGRKVYAVDLMHRYGDVEKVRRALNHERAAVTILYACADQLVRQGKRGRSRRARGW
jgi:integrase